MPSTANNPPLPADDPDGTVAAARRVWDPSPSNAATNVTRPAAAAAAANINAAANDCAIALYINNDEKVQPRKRTNFILMLASNQGIIDVEQVYGPIRARPGKAALFQWRKDSIVAALLFHNPDARVNKKNKSVQQLMNMLPPLDDPQDIAYITTAEAQIRKTLFDSAAEEDSEAAANATARMTMEDHLRYILVMTSDEVLPLYLNSQNPATREQIDAGVTPKDLFHIKQVEKFNDASFLLSTVPNRTLHSDFHQPIVCNKGDFELTVEKSKDVVNTIRRTVTSMASKYELSGNGANQRDVSNDQDDGEDLPDNWGRFDANRMREWAEESGATNDGDDRANFLGPRPTFYLYTWHILDVNNLIRFTCAQLRDEHSASSDETPRPVSRQRTTGPSSARSRKLSAIAEANLELQKTLVASMTEMGRAVASMSGDDTMADAFAQAQKQRRLDKLRSERYNMMVQAVDSEMNDAQKKVASDRVAELNREIERAEEEDGSD